VKRDIFEPHNYQAFIFLSLLLFTPFLPFAGNLVFQETIGEFSRFQKLFFVLEDLLFIAFSVVLIFFLKTKKWTLALCLGYFSLLYLTSYGRFSVLVSLLILFLVFGVRLSLRSLTSSLLVVAMSVSLLFVIEGGRSKSEQVPVLLQLLGDRISEVASLRVVSDIFEYQKPEGLVNFDRLKLLYVPSVLYEKKETINDGSEYMFERFQLGKADVGEAQVTRFPILFHVDGFRRFGWFGLFFGFLPLIFLKVGVLVSKFFTFRLGVPFVWLLVLKYSFYIYPRSLLGNLEVFLYTVPRSALILWLLLLLCVLIPVRRQRRSRELRESLPYNWVFSKQEGSIT
jgi:hypothetical protein